MTPNLPPPLERDKDHDFQHLRSALSIISHADCSSLPPPASPVLDRNFTIAPEENIEQAAVELCDLILATSEAGRIQCIGHLVALLYDSGTASLDHARSIALLAEDVMCILQESGCKGTLDLYRDGLVQFTVELFEDDWEEMSLTETLPTESEETHLQRVSAFTADLYAVNIMRLVDLERCIRAMIKAVKRPTHFICILIILSRANSYNGAKLPSSLYSDITRAMSELSTEDLTSLNDCSQERALLNSFIQHLLEEDLAGVDLDYCDIPFTHEVDEALDCSNLLLTDTGDLEQIFLYASNNDSDKSTLCSARSHSSEMSSEATKENEGKIADTAKGLFEGEDFDDWHDLSDLCLNFNEAKPASVDEGLQLSIHASLPSSLTVAEPAPPTPSELMGLLDDF